MLRNKRTHRNEKPAHHNEENQTVDLGDTHWKKAQGASGQGSASRARRFQRLPRTLHLRAPSEVSGNRGAALGGPRRWSRAGEAVDGDDAGSAGLGTSRGETPGGEPGADGAGRRAPAPRPCAARCRGRGDHTAAEGTRLLPAHGAFSVPSRPLTLSPLLCFISEIET
ncbi:hypothetical protein J1605_008375 [Eschrichtius robustus]|uniref:Uncharacterized protein n=1 Tax=Eschrichtius robustus TaxID=9764 RepID=A0AB34GXM9_ESCRO|nr:hypothetical protein J1605_008375 [Eschrichtius robustus]